MSKLNVKVGDWERYTSELQLTVGKWYCCMHISEFDEPDANGTFFKYLGDGTAEIDSNACGEPNEIDRVPYGDYYIDT